MAGAMIDPVTEEFLKMRRRKRIKQEESLRAPLGKPTKRQEEDRRRITAEPGVVNFVGGPNRPIRLFTAICPAQFDYSQKTS